MVSANILLEDLIGEITPEKVGDGRITSSYLTSKRSRMIKPLKNDIHILNIYIFISLKC